MEKNDSLKRKSVSGFLWSFIDMFATQSIQFIVLMILARLLTPENFGLIGMIALFMAISNSLIDSGFSQALIREKEFCQKDYSTVFFFNLFTSVALYAILFWVAPFVSEFFQKEELTKILRVLSLGLIINSFGLIQRVFLIKNINFRTQTGINLCSAVIAGVIAISLAYKGFGVWSLVIQNLTLQFIQSISLWIYNKWIPTLTFSRSSFTKLFGFGSKLLISGIIDTLYSNIYSIIIGKLYPAAQLGYYTNAAKLGDVITNSTTSALQRVSFPILSRIQDNEEQLKSSFKKIVRMIAFTMFPIMIGLIAIADSLIPILLGSKWVKSIIYFKLLCISGMIYPLHAINLNILQVKGRSDLFLRLEIIKKTLLTAMIGVSIYLSLGINGLIGAAIVTSYCSLFINAYYSAREISYSILQQLQDVLPIFLLSLLMGLVVFVLGSILPFQHSFIVIFQILVGFIVYLGVGYLFKINEIMMLTHLYNQYINLPKKGLKKSKGA